MGSKLSEIPKGNLDTSAVDDSEEAVVQFNTDGVLPNHMQTASVLKHDDEKNNDAFEDEEVIHFVGNFQTETPTVKTFLEKSVKFIVGFLAVFLIGFIFVMAAKNGIADESLKRIEPTEAATQRVVPATDEKLKFKKDSYKVEVGKTVKTEHTYTPPYSEDDYDEPKITYTSNNIEIATVDKSGKITGVGTGMTSISAVTSTGLCTTVPVTVVSPKKHIIKDVPMILQGSDYPSGCESVSTTMLLEYYGFEMDADRFIDDYLPKGSFRFDDKGQMYGPDAYSAFLGSPYSEQALGCFPPVIEVAMNDYFADKGFRAVDITGSSMESIINRYIVKNEPVLIWATMWMNEPVVTYEWKVEDAAENSPYKNGDTFEWLANEHCMLLVGYDEDYYYLNDPLVGKKTKYDKKTFNKRYTQMGRCALVIDKTK